MRIEKIRGSERYVFVPSRYETMFGDVRIVSDYVCIWGDFITKSDSRLGAIKEMLEVTKDILYIKTK